MKIEAFKDLTRIEQTLFGLPFLLSGALLPFADKGNFPATNWLHWLWIFPAFLLARISGMAFNQLIDRQIDGSNPRTKNRAIPSGRVTVSQARRIAWGALALFIFVCLRINFICALLAPLAAFLLFIYSYMKRIHASCHFVLGLIHLLGPVMAAVAVKDAFSLPSIFLGLAASFSIIGNDIAYAIQDYEFDCKNSLHSLPSSIGIEKSLSLSLVLHVLCPLMLLLVGFTAHLPLFYYLFLPLILAAFYHFHTRVRSQYKKSGSVRGIESVFFFSNVIVAIISFFFISTGILWVALL